MKKKPKVPRRSIISMQMEMSKRGSTSHVLDLGLLPKSAIDKRPIHSEIAHYILAAEYRKKLDGDLHSRVYTPG